MSKSEGMYVLISSYLRQLLEQKNSFKLFWIWTYCIYLSDEMLESKKAKVLCRKAIAA